MYSGGILRHFFHISRQGWHSQETFKNFIVYFFAALTKHEILMKYVTIQGETDLMSENKFSRYGLLKLEVLFLPPNL